MSDINTEQLKKENGSKCMEKNKRFKLSRAMKNECYIGNLAWPFKRSNIETKNWNYMKSIMRGKINWGKDGLFQVEKNVWAEALRSQDKQGRRITVRQVWLELSGKDDNTWSLMVARACIQWVFTQLSARNCSKYKHIAVGQKIKFPRLFWWRWI